MADKKQVVIPPSSPRMPVTRSPQATLPSLPSSSGKWLGSPSRLLEADLRYVEIHAAFLRARGDQATAMRELLSAREQLALAVARLQSLSLICEHEFIKGKMERASELALLALKQETAEVQARAELVAARHLLAAYEPQPPEPPPAPPSPAPAGLDPREVEAVLQRFPDIKPESIEPIIMVLRGILAEKKA